MNVNDPSRFRERITDEVVWEIEKEIKKQYKTWTRYADLVGVSKFNIKNQLMSRVRRVNEILKPIGFELTIIRRNKRL